MYSNADFDHYFVEFRLNMSYARVGDDYSVVSRWMHKTLTNWQTVLKSNGNEVLLYEEYIDFTTNADHFKSFIDLLAEFCPNLRHVRLLFPSDKNDEPEDGFVKYALQLPYIKCLSLFDAPLGAVRELMDDCKITTMKFSGVPQNIGKSDFIEILGTMKGLHSLVYHYKGLDDNRFVCSLANVTTLRNLTLHYMPSSEFKLLKHLSRLEVLQVHNLYERIQASEFVDVFKSLSNLHTLSISFLEQNLHLSREFHKLDSYCPQLTYLTLNMDLENYGDFKNLKYLKFDVDHSLSCLNLDTVLTKLAANYANRLQILDISECPLHCHTTNITKLKALRAFLCASWSSTMLKCVSDIPNLEFFSIDDAEEDLELNILDFANSCKALRYLQLPYSDKIETNVSDITVDKQFVLTLKSKTLISPTEIKVSENLTRLDLSGKIFGAKLKQLIKSLRESRKAEDASNISIFQNPSKVAGDRFEVADTWMSNTNYKLALRNCRNKYSMDLDEELINRCRNMFINDADYELANMQFAFNFKYDELDAHNHITK